MQRKVRDGRLNSATSKPEPFTNRRVRHPAGFNRALSKFRCRAEGLGTRPVLLQIPPTLGAGFFGSILDAWQAPLTDVGANGSDEGKGGKYILSPPGYKSGIPAGYFPIQFQTVNGYGLLRAIPDGFSEAAQVKAIELVKKIRL
jgi:hypothetical protein